VYTIYYTCDVNPDTKPEMAEWSKELFPWLKTQNFVFHRSMRNAGIDKPELVAYFDFNDEASAQEFWSSPGWKDTLTKFRMYTSNMREHRLDESPLTGLGMRGTQTGDANYTILYTCDVKPECKPDMAAWTATLLPWLKEQKFIYHRSTRNAGVDSPELIAYFDFEDAVSANEFWTCDGWKEVIAKFGLYTTNQREYRLLPSPLSGYGIEGTQKGDMAR